MKTRAEATAIIIIALAVLGLGLWGAPKLWHKATRNAKASEVATQQLSAAIEAKQVASEAQASSAAAGVATIGRAAADLPASPATDFVRAEVPAVLAKLPAPDPAALLEAEKRRTAMMEGKFELAQKLYREEGDRATKLERDLADKQHALERAMDERRKVDTRLAEAAAAERAQMLQKFLFMGTTVIALALGLWVKVNGLSYKTVGSMVKDIRAGDPPLTVVDKYVPVRLWPKVKRQVQLQTEPQTAPTAGHTNA